MPADGRADAVAKPLQEAIHGLAITTGVQAFVAAILPRDMDHM